jgi:hypothetical protein
MRNENIINTEMYLKVFEEYKKIMKQLKNINNLNNTDVKNKYDENKAQEVNVIYKKFIDEMDSICSNTYELVDYLINIFYIECPSSNKDLLWNTYGNIIFENIKIKNQNSILFPFPNKEGKIEYLNQRFLLKEVEL